MFWTMNDMPIAVISGARRGAWRSGLYATRSIVALKSGEDPSSATKSSSPPMMTGTLESVSRPSTETMIVLAKSPDSANDVAVGEVDQLQDPVDEGVAERDDAVDRAVRQADDPDVDELDRPLEKFTKSQKRRARRARARSVDVRRSSRSERGRHDARL